jgi:hypothetical protein
MMVMMTAITPSLNASSRFFSIVVGSRFYVCSSWVK